MVAGGGWLIRAEQRPADRLEGHDVFTAVPATTVSSAQTLTDYVDRSFLCEGRRARQPLTAAYPEQPSARPQRPSWRPEFAILAACRHRPAARSPANSSAQRLDLADSDQERPRCSWRSRSVTVGCANGAGPRSPPPPTPRAGPQRRSSSASREVPRAPPGSPSASRSRSMVSSSTPPRERFQLHVSATELIRRASA